MKNHHKNHATREKSPQIPPLKIIGGSLKGRRLNIALLSNTRPTKAILRESLFNTLGNAIVKKSFLEVFAGYGAVGFEALSRGASEIYFSEKNPQTFGILQQNIKMICDIDSTLDRRIHAFNADSFEITKKLLGEIDIAYFDPPFGDEYYNACFRLLERHFSATHKNKMIGVAIENEAVGSETMEDKILGSDMVENNTTENKNLASEMAENKILMSETQSKIIIFEHISNFAMPQKLGTLTLSKTRKFGRSSLSYYLV